jgi:DNA-binding MarR family transcriptional regulator
MRYNRIANSMTISKNISRSDYQALAEFRYQIRRFVRFSEEAAREAGVEPHQHQLMLAIKGCPHADEPPRIAYLAERLQIQHHSAVELVDRLVKKGLITRMRGDEDRREVHVQLTARGERVLGELTMHTRAELRSAAPTLAATLLRLTVRSEIPAKTRRRPRATAARRR